MAWFVPALIAGLGAAAGALSNRQKQQQQQMQQQSTTQGSQSQSYENLTQPYLSPIQDYLQNYLFQNLVGRANEDVDLSGYTSAGLQNINRGADARQQVLNNILVRRGLSSSPAGAAALGGLQSNRISDSMNFLNQIPLLRNQLQREKLTDVSSFLSSLPTALRQVGSQAGNTFSTTQGTGTSTTTIPGDVLGGLFGGGGSLLGLLYGLGAFANKGTPNPNTTTFSGIGGTGIR